MRRELLGRLLTGVAARTPAGADLAEEEVDGTPCLVVRTGGVVTQVFSLETDGDRVASVQVVQHPGKLARLSQT